MRRSIQQLGRRSNSERSVTRYVSQPTRWTHKHLVAADETLPGVPTAHLSERRRKLASKLPVNSVAFFAASPTSYATADVEYPYRADSNMFYLAGMLEKHSLLMIEKKEKKKKKSLKESLVNGFTTTSDNKTTTTTNSNTDTENEDNYEIIATIFCAPRSQQKEVWDGPIMGPDDAQVILGVDRAESIEAIAEDKFLAKIRSYPNRFASDSTLDFLRNERLVSSKNELYTLLQEESQSPAEPDESEVKKNNSNDISFLDRSVQSLRSQKTVTELNQMRNAAILTCQAFVVALGDLKPGSTEAEIASLIEFVCKRSGSQRMAYPPIVASGGNSCVLHYTLNNQIMQDGDLVLIDAGCEMEGYACDVTRTWPIGGRFSLTQRDAYSVVLNAQRACLDAVAKACAFRNDAIGKLRKNHEHEVLSLLNMNGHHEHEVEAIGGGQRINGSRANGEVNGVNGEVNGVNGEVNGVNGVVASIPPHLKDAVGILSPSGSLLLGKEINPNHPSLASLQDVAVQNLTQGLLDLGVLDRTKTTLEECIEKEYYKPFYPHSIGHFLGIDVHDCPSVPKDTPLCAGHVFTVEPGLYFDMKRICKDETLRNVLGNQTILESFDGIGVRIEDTVGTVDAKSVSKSSAEAARKVKEQLANAGNQLTTRIGTNGLPELSMYIFTKHAPKEIEVIEDAMAEAKAGKALQRHHTETFFV